MEKCPVCDATLDLLSVDPSIHVNLCLDSKNEYNDSKKTSRYLDRHTENSFRSSNVLKNPSIDVPVQFNLLHSCPICNINLPDQRNFSKLKHFEECLSGKREFSSLKSNHETKSKVDLLEKCIICDSSWTSIIYSTSRSDFPPKNISNKIDESSLRARREIVSHLSSCSKDNFVTPKILLERLISYDPDFKALNFDKKRLSVYKRLGSQTSRVRNSEEGLGVSNNNKISHRDASKIITDSDSHGIYFNQSYDKINSEELRHETLRRNSNLDIDKNFDFSSTGISSRKPPVVSEEADQYSMARNRNSKTETNHIKNYFNVKKTSPENGHFQTIYNRDNINTKITKKKSILKSKPLPQELDEDLQTALALSASLSYDSNGNNSYPELSPNLLVSNNDQPAISLANSVFDVLGKQGANKKANLKKVPKFSNPLKRNSNLNKNENLRSDILTPNEGTHQISNFDIDNKYMNPESEPRNFANESSRSKNSLEVNHIILNKYQPINDNNTLDFKKIDNLKKLKKEYSRKLYLLLDEYIGYKKSISDNLSLNNQKSPEIEEPLKHDSFSSGSSIIILEDHFNSLSIGPIIPIATETPLKSNNLDNNKSPSSIANNSTSNIYDEYSYEIDHKAQLELFVSDVEEVDDFFANNIENLSDFERELVDLSLQEHDSNSFGILKNKTDSEILNTRQPCPVDSINQKKVPKGNDAYMPKILQ
ncbi:hypothetical protein AYI68_g2311 [Smittium mucronatum]|uniref:Uncharacterized protein n=1 Tax=Smittium mucronatum TaxID=133383 RepID=A0A1R0H2Z0_9FUNG|nr:hypothetical protein AYI68_g2311 [Smittium mucronatum]